MRHTASMSWCVSNYDLTTMIHVGMTYIIRSVVELTKHPHILCLRTINLVAISEYFGESSRCYQGSVLYWLNWLILPWTKWPSFCRRYFHMHFCEWKFLYFDSYFTEACSLGSNCQYVSIGSGNGLVPIRRQDFCTSANPVYWRLYATLGDDELSFILDYIANFFSFIDSPSTSVVIGTLIKFGKWMCD